MTRILHIQPTSAVLQTLALCLFISCGVEVGNPTRPIAAPSESDQEILALVSEEQLEEAMGAASENQSAIGNINDTALSLLASRSCEVSTDGAVIYTVDKEDTGVIDLPLKKPTTRVNHAGNHHVESILKNNPGASGLACRAGGHLPAIDWTVLTGFQAEVAMTRTADRTFTDLSSATLKSSVHVTAKGNRQVVWDRLSLAGNEINLQKTIHFETNLKRISTKEGGTYEGTVKTAAELVIQQSMDGPEIKSFRIVSGSVLSDYKVDQKLKLTYSNLEFIKGGSCYPQSGSIDAAVFVSADLDNPSLTYKVIFDGGEAALVFEDGTQKPLLLSDCTIKGN